MNKPFLTVVAVPMGFGDSTKELSTGNTKKGNRKEMETKNCAVYVVVGYDADGRKDVLGLWIVESERKHRYP